MGEPACRIFRRDSRQRPSYRLYQRLAHACALLAYEGLDLGEGLLYGIQVRRVGRQEQEICSPGFDELSYPLWPVSPEPIEHHHLPLTKRGGQKVLHVSLEGLGIRGSFYGHRLSHRTFEGNRSDEGGVLAAVSRNLAVGPLSPRSPGVEAHHGGVKARLVHKH